MFLDIFHAKILKEQLNSTLLMYSFACKLPSEISSLK